MPRFFFDLIEDDRATIDSEGTELAENRPAQQEAFEYLGDVARDRLRKSRTGQLILNVFDADRKPLMTAKLSLEVQGAPQ